ncbi:hypothetical protein X975_02942, partial [Stegodyphus mimosarum]
MGPQFLFMDDNAPPHRTVTVEELLESEDIEHMDWLARSLDLNPVKHIGLQRIPSHVDNLGNDIIDTLAKAGAGDDFFMRFTSLMYTARH